MNFCVECGQPRRGSARYCAACGTPFREAVTGEIPVPPKPTVSRPDPGPDTHAGTIATDADGATAAELAATPAVEQSHIRQSRTMLIGVALAALAVIASAIAVTVAIAGSRQTHVNASTSSSSPQPSPSPTSSSSQPSPSPTPTTSLTARSEAKAISNLLSSSARSRSALLSGPVLEVGQCINVSNDIQQLQQIVSQRMDQYNQARNLQTGAVQNGEILKSELAKALLASRNADNEFLRWAQQQKKSSCAVGYSSAYYDDGNAADNVANYDKEALVSTWNPVAPQYGLRQFSAGQI